MSLPAVETAGIVIKPLIEWRRSFQHLLNTFSTITDQETEMGMVTE